MDAKIATVITIPLVMENNVLNIALTIFIFLLMTEIVLVLAQIIMNLILMKLMLYVKRHAV